MRLKELFEGKGKKPGDVIPWAESTYYAEYNISKDNIETLIGCPESCFKGFSAANNPLLTSLVGGPKLVEGGSNLGFDVSTCNLTNVKGMPEKIVDCAINLSNNQISSLEGFTQDLSGIYGIDLSNNKLTSLKGLPPDLGDSHIQFADNEINTIEGFPSKFEGMNIQNNKLTNLHDIHKYVKECTGIYLVGNPIKSHVLGVLKIKGMDNLTFVPFDDNKSELSKVQDIIHRYLPQGDLLACQQELIDAGFEEFAQL